MKKFFYILALFSISLAVFAQATGDSIANKEESQLRFPIPKNYVENYNDLGQSTPASLPIPDNVVTEVVYDPDTDRYYFQSKVGDEDLGTPFYLTSDEFAEYQALRSQQEYYKAKVSEEKGKKHEISFTDMKFDIGPADKVFGPGGVQLKLQGSVELIFALQFKKLKDPALSERSQNPAPTFDFDEKIQLNVSGSVGDKLNFGLNYNTEATFDFDQSMLKLQYEGKEDDIIKKLEAGNVSMPLTGSLITGNTSLFGFKTDLQFGKLNVSAVVSQQESESQTINTTGAQTTDFHISIDQYDENRHYFLSHFFREHYDEWMKDVPNISSGVSVTNIEVWVTNKNSINYQNTTNVVAFADLGEPERIYNSSFAPSGSLPSNGANTLFSQVVQANNGLPDIYEVDSYLKTWNMEAGTDFAKLEGARKLESSDYVLNKELGYISLKSALNNDEILAVAYQYTYKGKVYTVGELSTATTETTKPLALKLLKSTDKSPLLPTWDLMMKNIYSLGAYQVQSNKFTLNIMYKNDSTGIDLRYITEGPIAKKPLLWVMNLDHLDSQQNEKPNGDGMFDFVEGYTIISQNGKIIFPVVEPFGSHLAKKLNNDPYLVKKYVYQELYDSTLTTAQEFAEKNKFYLEGEYRASSGSEIRLNAMNVPKGSVKVTAGGVQLTENVDYTVDYMMGVVTIMNQDLIDLGTPISVTMESQSMFNMKRKSLIGTHLDYAFTDNFNVGGTVMYLSEKPLTEKVGYGDDPVANTVWGLNMSYRDQFQSVTDWLNKLPILNLKQASTVAFDAEFAHMIPGTAKGAQGKVYVDDFESTTVGYDVRYASNWRLASTPSRFAESGLSNNIEYGKNRALLSWYYIDNMFNQSTSSTPSHIRKDKQQLSNHFVRQVSENEIFPNRELVYGQSSYIQTLDLAYHPTERGPYNIYAENFDSEGKLINPATKWGGVMRKLETTDFETNNIEYLEFWVMDPFVYNDGTMTGGDLYFNFGDISEDILKDGRKFYENGLPVELDESAIVSTVWGKVPTKQSVVYAFDATEAARKAQDTGLNGLSTEQEFNHESYKTFVEKLSAKLSPDARQRMLEDKFSPLNDPAGDNFHHYRGTDYDNAEVGVLERYRYYNGTEGNSQTTSENESYTTASSNKPDYEDINVDNTLSDSEKYFEYRVSLRPEDMNVGQNYITDMVTSSVTLKNGETGTVRWYQFKIPLRDADNYTSYGSIRSFKSIRFMRMYLTGFTHDVNLRFARMELVKGEWRTYQKELDKANHNDATILEVSSVNIEENADKQPVNYVLPPGVSREIDPSQQQVRQENEQSMVLRIHNLYPKDARAVYKKFGGYDMRQYGKLEMFVHAEALPEDDTNLTDRDMKLFIRLGSDYQNNYYEYEVPLTLTPAGIYSNNTTSDRKVVWPSENKIELPLELLTNLKKARNEEKNRNHSSVTNLTEYSTLDPANPNNRVTIMGNPSLGEVEVFMIGIRNASKAVKSAEVWVNELLLTDFDEQGGVAARASLDIALSDFITLNAAGRIETIGYGGIEQKVQERRQDDYYQYNVNAGIDLGKLLPEKANTVIPVRYSLSHEIVNPKYNPLDKDILLKDALEATANKEQRDSILNVAQDMTMTQSLSVPGIRVGITSKDGPRPWDPANFTVGGSYSQTESRDPNTTREVEQYSNAYGQYEFSWSPKPVEPFAKIKSIQNNKHMKWLTDFGFYYAPKLFSFKTNFVRNYYEQVTRDFENPDQKMDPTFAKDFMWSNEFDLAWDITKNIKFTFTSSNNSLITENDGGVNSDLYPDEYEMWKDSVWNSLSHLGSPQDYNQRVTLSWNVPFNKMPALNWIQGNIKYDGTYQWLSGTDIIANTAMSKGTIQADGKFNFESLYNKSEYLKEINRKYGSTNAPKPKKQKEYNQKLKLQAGDTVVVRHRLNDKKVRIKATADGKAVQLKHKVLDANSIKVFATKGAEVELTVISGGPQPANMVFTDVLARIAMLIRNVSFNYSQTDGTTLPGYLPSVQGLGMSSFNNKTAPTFAFVVGIQEDDILDKALSNGWLLTTDAVYNPAQFVHTETFKATALVEPFPGIKINVQADRQFVNNRSVQFSAGSNLTNLDGSLSMSYVAIGTAFTSVRGGVFTDELFNNFLAYRNVIKNRLESQNNPTSGYSLNSDDVLVPAFLAAYAGRDASKVDTKSVPKFWSFLPNWQVTITALNRIPWVKEHFRSVNITHGYTCKYQIGSFSSDQTFTSINGDDFGYVEDVLSGGLLPSSRYALGAVTINEQFSPLVGLDMNLKNSLSFKAEWRRGRNMGLNIASNQIVESSNNEYVVGIGYKFSDLKFNMKTAKSSKQVKNDLTLRADFSIKDAKTLVRKIELNQTQATAGDLVTTFKFAANYVFSERLNFSLFYDLQMRTPVVSTSYPTLNSEVGISAKILLTR